MSDIVDMIADQTGCTVTYEGPGVVFHSDGERVISLSVSFVEAHPLAAKSKVKAAIENRFLDSRDDVVIEE